MDNATFFNDDMTALKTVTFPDAKVTLYRLKDNPDNRAMDHGLFVSFADRAYSYWVAKGCPNDCRVNFGSWWRITAHG